MSLRMPQGGAKSYVPAAYYIKIELRMSIYGGSCEYIDEVGQAAFMYIRKR